MNILKKILPNYESFVKKLDLSFIFNSFNKNMLEEISLNTNIQISLKSLNLSYSALDTSTLHNFIKNNSGFINLKILDISHNYIDDSFIDIYLKENYSSLLENLEMLNLSNNNLSIAIAEQLIEIINSQKKINLIYLNKNPIEEDFIKFIIAENKDDLKLTQVEQGTTIQIFNKEEENYNFDKMKLFNNLIAKLNNITKTFKIYFSKNFEKIIRNITTDTNNKTSERKVANILDVINKYIIFK